MTEYQHKEQICEIGRRLYNRGFAAANDGNITVRLGANEFLCTPTMVSKGFMKPDDICKVDINGKQLAGQKKRTSEVLLHLAIYKERPDINAVVHCHPPHATAFAVAGEPIPKCVLPEVEVFLGEVPMAMYETPGGQKFAETIVPFVKGSNTIILANHGTVTFGPTLENAYFNSEIIDAYCKILILAKQLGRVNYFTNQQTQELLDLKKRIGYDDPRFHEENCDLCGNSIFERGYKDFVPEPHAFRRDEVEKPKASSNGKLSDRDLEKLVGIVTDRVMEALQTAEHRKRLEKIMKVSIIGGGGLVGSMTAYALQCSGAVSHIGLVDANADAALGQATDLLHGSSLVADQRITAAGMDEVKDSDAIVITAGLRRKPDESRLDLINRNVDLFLGLLDQIQKVGLKDNAYLVVVSNPVDVLTYLAVQRLGLPWQRVLGLGTQLDTARFRSYLAQRLKAPATQVQALILGEHGDSMVPIWSSATVGGLPLEQWPGFTTRLGQEVFDETKKAGATVIKLKGGSGFAVGLSIRDVVESILLDKRRVLPVSTLVRGVYDLRDVCISVPTVVGCGGAREQLELPLIPKERMALQQSARVLRETINQVEGRIGKTTAKPEPAPSAANARTIPRTAWLGAKS